MGLLYLRNDREFSRRLGGCKVLFGTELPTLCMGQRGLTGIGSAIWQTVLFVVVSSFWRLSW